VILIGPAIESSFWLLERSPLARPRPAALEPRAATLEE
jgi:hypothetical protein